MRPLILLSNDDGYSAPNLVAVQAELSKVADVVVCAPETNQSATSHSLSLHRVLRLRKAGPSVFAVDGTPADSVYIALHSGGRVLERRPDLVVSGMNHGLNLGSDIFYSGTVAAAREGALRGIPSLALSADSGADRETAAALGAQLALALLEAVKRTVHRGAPLLNVNVPPGKGWPIRATRIGSRLYTEEVLFREDPRGREYLWIGGAGVRHDHVPGSDTEAYDEGCVSITPLTLDLFAAPHEQLAADLASGVAQAAK